MIAKFMVFLRKIQFHWIVTYLAFGLACYVHFFQPWLAFVSYALMLLLRRQIGKWDLHIPPATPKI